MYHTKPLLQNITQNTITTKKKTDAQKTNETWRKQQIGSFFQRESALPSAPAAKKSSPHKANAAAKSRPRARSAAFELQTREFRRGFLM
jgi:hypothetical protein